MQPKCVRRHHFVNSHTCWLCITATWAFCYWISRRAGFGQTLWEMPTNSKQFCSFHLWQISGFMWQILMSKHLLLSESNLPWLPSLLQHEIQTFPPPFVITHAGFKLKDSLVNSWRGDNDNTEKLKQTNAVVQIALVLEWPPHSFLLWPDMKQGPATSLKWECSWFPQIRNQGKDAAISPLSSLRPMSHILLSCLRTGLVPGGQRTEVSISWKCPASKGYQSRHSDPEHSETSNPWWNQLGFPYSLSNRHLRWGLLFSSHVCFLAHVTKGWFAH